MNRKRNTENAPFPYPSIDFSDIQMSQIAHLSSHGIHRIHYFPPQNIKVVFGSIKIIEHETHFIEEKIRSLGKVG